MPTAFATPVERRYFEDYVQGDVHEFGSIGVSESEIVEFARAYDPQPFHTDAEAARQTPFGGLIASGWQTAGLMMRLVVDHYLSLASLRHLRTWTPRYLGNRKAIRLRVDWLGAAP